MKNKIFKVMAVIMAAIFILGAISVSAAPSYVKVNKDYKRKAFDGYIQIKLIDSNGQSQIYNVAQKVTYNGKKIKNIEEIVNDISYNGKYCYGLENLPEEEIFRYTLNSNGEISMIDTYEELLGDMNDTLIKHNDSKLSMKYSKDAGILSADDSLKFYMKGDSLVYSYYTDIEEKEEFWRVGVFLYCLHKLVQFTRRGFLLNLII